MSKAGWLIGGLFAVGGLTWLAVKGKNLVDAANDIVIDITDVALSVNGPTPVIEFKVAIKNPTAAVLTILDPFVTVAYEGTIMASSKPTTDTINLAAYGESSKFIKLDLSLMGAAGTLLALLTKILAKQKIDKKFDIKVITEVNGIRIPPFTKTVGV